MKLKLYTCFFVSLITLNAYGTTTLSDGLRLTPEETCESESERSYYKDAIITGFYIASDSNELQALVKTKTKTKNEYLLMHTTGSTSSFSYDLIKTSWLTGLKVDICYQNRSKEIKSITVGNGQ